MAIEKKEVKTKFYKLLKEVGANEKCPPQAKLIVDTIKAAGGRIERGELITLLKRPVEQGGLKTNQTAERILGFYKPKLQETGVMVEETEVTVVEVEVPDKPKAAEKTAAAGEGAAAPTTGTPKTDSVKDKKGHKKEAA